MERGKEICKALKEIRRKIASENDIELVISECRHKGDCAGTCPKCEAEVLYLENQLAARQRLGKAVKVVGLSMGLAAIAPALFTSCDPTTIKTATDGDVIMRQGEMVTPQNTGNKVLEGDIASDIKDFDQIGLE